MLLRIIFAALSAALIGNSAYAGAHNEVSYYRSSTVNYTYFAQSIEGGFGDVVFDMGSEDEKSMDWKSFKLKSEFGIETMKFIKLSAGFLKEDYKKMADESKSMDKLSAFAEAKIILNTPIFNIEVGSGATASTLDMFQGDLFGTYAGSGKYYSFGIARFLSSNTAVFAKYSTFDQFFVKNSGTTEVSNIKFLDRSIGAGFSIYF